MRWEPLQLQATEIKDPLYQVAFQSLIAGAAAFCRSYFTHARVPIVLRNLANVQRHFATSEIALRFHMFDDANGSKISKRVASRF